MVAYLAFSLNELVSQKVSRVSQSRISLDETEEETQTPNRLIRKLLALQLFLLLGEMIPQLMILPAFEVDHFNLVFGLRVWGSCFIGLLLYIQYFVLRSSLTCLYKSLVSICLHGLVLSIIVHSIFSDIYHGICIQNCIPGYYLKYFVLCSWILVFLFNVYLGMGTLALIFCFFAIVCHVRVNHTFDAELGEKSPIPFQYNTINCECEKSSSP